ncbi:MAG: N-acetylmuramoyl-L-alanine amidase [Candidatus Omnitrophica bacterium]|nr:N-acetylmuramoyl-L-alanine amidase [Candidatus Omnitrophota bacterium]
MKKSLYIGILIPFVMLFSSCVTAPMQTATPALYPAPTPVPFPAPARGDVIHLVGPGETLWRISKMYDVNAQDIIRANGIRNPSFLLKGQKLIIPHASGIVPVVTLYPSGKWKYIIIHHSATDSGTALDFDRSHNNKGWRGLGYHFVIDNGTKGKQKGQIEVAPRWLKQQNGSHCKASGMNSKAIGICLVGNFSNEYVSARQMDSLVWLVDRLRRHYKIPLKNVVGHGQVRGARTECPGKNFPWSKFKRAL